MDIKKRKISRSIVFAIGIFLGGLIISFYVGPAYVELADSGVDVKWDSTRLTTHSKLMIVEGKIILIGSTNWSYYSFSKNHESNVIFNNKESAKRFENYFEELW